VQWESAHEGRVQKGSGALQRSVEREHSPPVAVEWRATGSVAPAAITGSPEYRRSRSARAVSSGRSYWQLSEPLSRLAAIRIFFIPLQFLSAVSALEDKAVNALHDEAFCVLESL